MQICTGISYEYNTFYSLTSTYVIYIHVYTHIQGYIRHKCISVSRYIYTLVYLNISTQKIYNSVCVYFAVLDVFLYVYVFRKYSHTHTQTNLIVYVLISVAIVILEAICL